MFFPRFRAYFSLQTLQFFDGGAKILYFYPRGTWYPSYASDKIIEVGYSLMHIFNALVKCFFRAFLPIFHFKHCKFFDGGAKILYFCPRGTLVP